MKKEPVQPSTRLNAFSCLHCGVLTTQHWQRALVQFSEKGDLPLRIDDLESYKASLVEHLGKEQAEPLFDFAEKMVSGSPWIGDRYERYSRHLHNVDVSDCYNCGKVTLWVGNQVVWPRANEAPPPNLDLPPDVEADYLEAGQIVNASPRGAAALLRLAIQKLCVALGKSGKNINDDIAELVKDGLDERVQKMLDVVRVVGNNAVHPGELDLRDNRDIAERLFGLVNRIADIMISQPRAIEEMYSSLPVGALEAIDRRDGRPS